MPRWHEKKLYMKAFSTEVDIHRELYALEGMLHACT